MFESLQILHESVSGLGTAEVLACSNSGLVMNSLDNALALE